MNYLIRRLEEKRRRVAGSELCEERLIKRAQSGEKDATEILISLYWKKIFKYSSKYFYSKKDNRSDIFSCAIHGFIEAVRKFDFEKGSLWTYAEYWIKARISEFFKKDSEVDLGWRFSKGEEYPEVFPIIDERDLLDNVEFELKGEKIENVLFLKLEMDEILRASEKILTENQKRAFFLYLKLGPRRSFAELGRRMGLSRQRAGQLIEASIRKLKKIFLRA